MPFVVVEIHRPITRAAAVKAAVFGSLCLDAKAQPSQWTTGGTVQSKVFIAIAVSKSHKSVEKTVQNIVTPNAIREK